jgi:hypothetical protein
MSSPLLDAEPLIHMSFCPDNVILLPYAQYQRLQSIMMTKALYS